MKVTACALGLLVALLVGALAACASGAGNAAPAAPPSGAAAVAPAAPPAAAAPTASALWVAKDAGFFAGEGLDVDLLFVAGGSALVNAVIAGDTPYAGLTGLASVNSYLAGADTIAIAAIVNYLPYHLMVRPEVQSGADLRGKPLAIARLGSASDFAARYLVQSLGLDPERDVSLLQVGDQAGRLAALDAGQVAGALMESPFTVRAREAGYRSL